MNSATWAAATVLMVFASSMPFADAAAATKLTCGHVKEFFNAHKCCKNADKKTNFQIVPDPVQRMSGSNPCAGKKSLTIPGMNNVECFKKAVKDAGEDGGADVTELNAGPQSGADVTKRYVGGIETTVRPISTPYYKTALCPVNVHWHLGAEHRSAGQYDETGTSPADGETPARSGRRLGDNPRYGFACKKYTSSSSLYTKEYDWRHCVGMKVGRTYEVHWPHSSLGACGTPYQYQTPFYDGVFCNANADLLGSLGAQDVASNVGVQAQVFTIVNDERYYYPDLFRGMIIDTEYSLGSDIATYVGSTTGTTRNNAACSSYTPITWQVDRLCHLISASSFDKMCADMKQMRDDMSVDLHAHGARVLVWRNLTAAYRGNQVP